jgi:hypothetical protein
MRFLEKYELIEQVTSGAVDTFVGRELASGERVLVHIFSGSDPMAGQAALQWALQSFRSLAPPPMGTVVEGGRYLQAPGAYLVTKSPDMPGLTAWVRLYKSQSEKTQEFVAPGMGSAPAQEQKLQTKPLPASALASRGESSGAFRSVPVVDKGVHGERDRRSLDEPTTVFTPGDIPASPVRAAVPAGPSEFAQAVSRPPSSGGPAGPDIATAPSPPPGESAPTPIPASYPQTPSAQVLQSPAPLPLNGPGVTASPLPRAPVSYWPLIIVMNVLLLAAVALVLYFALKK